MSEDLNKTEFLFISHANPEDNEFARWLTLRLANEGYPVFCEIVEFLGGEDAWRDIEDVIRHKTAKFVFVQSETSMKKNGTRKELNLAYQVATKENFQDFILPLKIEEFSHSEVCIELQTTISTPFEESWAKGLEQILKKLEKENISKSEKFNPSTVTSWWRKNFSAEVGLREEEETLLSNWYDIQSMPDKLYFHILHPTIFADDLTQEELTQFPYKVFDKSIVSFAKREDFENNEKIFADTHYFYLEHLFQNNHQDILSAMKARNLVSEFLRESWENKLEEKDLKTYELSSGTKCGYFQKDEVENDRLYFDHIISNDESNRLPYRQVIGYKTVNKESEKKRYWHFAVSGKPLMRKRKVFSINPHVLFSDDGEEIWKSKDRLHRVKMSTTSSWRNDRWRDCILSIMHYLAGDNKTINLKLGSSEIAKLDKTPVRFTSPIGYDDPKKTLKENIDKEIKHDDEEE